MSKLRSKKIICIFCACAAVVLALLCFSVCHAAATEVSLDITIEGNGNTENIKGTAVAVKMNGDWVIPDGVDCDKYENL